MYTNRNSSDYTKRLQDQTRYAAYLQSQQAVQARVTNNLGTEGAASEVTHFVHGQAFISAEEYSTIVASPSYILPDPTELVVVSFTSIGTTTWQAPPLTRSVEYLIVGGGGGGGNGYDTAAGGGGGGGMVLTGTTPVNRGTWYTIVVGDGGAGGSGPYPGNYNGSPGQDSQFGSIVAFGGGLGQASRTYTPTLARQGGAAQDGSNTSARGGGGGGSTYGGGGGGGAGGAGGNAAQTSGSIGGTGGAGLSSSLSGSEVTYGAGGAGARGNTAVTGADGVNNTGNGGGGGAFSSGGGRNGGKGGSGIVILKFYR